jgi:hypothetical protein
MKWWMGPVIGVSLLIGIAFASCNVIPTTSPISPLSVPPVNLLVNGGFDLPTHYEPAGETSMVIPIGWKAFALDEGGYLKLYEPSGVFQLGRYTLYRYGIRSGQDSEVLKAEVLHICRVAPYLDPLRIYEGECSVTGFKLYGHLAFGVQQTIATVPGHVYRFTGYGHAWSRMNEDPGDAHYSHNVGTAAFYGEEGDANVNDGNDNFRFRLCVDLAGAENVLGSDVVCGNGAMVYNVFHSLPPLTFTASSNTSTVFAFIDTRFGFVNSNAYLDSLGVEDVTLLPLTPAPTFTPTATATPTLGSPTVTPVPTFTPMPGITQTCVLSLTQRVYVLLPPGSSVEWYNAAAPMAAQRGWSIGTSAVDACVNSCGQRSVLVVNAQKWGCNLYPACRAPCGSLAYIPLSAPTPNDLALALERYPAWLKEAWGICLPIITRP